MTATAPYNRQAIMTRAWELMANRPYNRINMRYELRRAWHEAKRPVRKAAQTEADKIRAAIWMLENKDRWTQADYAANDALRADLRIAVAHENAAPVYAEKRDLIAAAGGRFCAVTFTKADGTTRIMQVQPATLRRHVKGDRATAAGRQATPPAKHVTRTCCPSGTLRPRHRAPSIWRLSHASPLTVRCTTTAPD